MVLEVAYDIFRIEIMSNLHQKASHQVDKSEHKQKSGKQGRETIQNNINLSSVAIVQC